MKLNHSEITNLITKNHHEKALKEMNVFASKFAKRHIDEISMHQTKLNALKRDNRIGILNRDEYTREMAKLTLAMLTLLNVLKEVKTNEDNIIQNLESFNVNELYKKVCRLYPKGLQDNRIWERSGGDLSYVSIVGTAVEQWWDALNKLSQRGGGNITFESLEKEIKKDFPFYS